MHQTLDYHRFFFNKICPEVLHLGGCNILIAMSALFTLFLLTTSKRIQKGAGFNKHAGSIVSFNIDKRAGSNKAVQGDKRFPNIMNAHVRLLEVWELQEIRANPEMLKERAQFSLKISNST